MVSRVLASSSAERMFGCGLDTFGAILGTRKKKTASRTGPICERCKWDEKEREGLELGETEPGGGGCGEAGTG